MLTSINILELFLNAVFSVLGLMVNSFITTVNFNNWFKRMEKVSINNGMVCTLAITNICLTCMFFSGTVIFLLWPEILYLDIVFKTYLSVELFWSGSSLWFANWLGVYFSTKIVTFNHQLFMKIKTRYSQTVPWLFMGSVEVSSAVSISTGCDPPIDLANLPSNHSAATSSNVSGNVTTMDLRLGSGCSTLFITQYLVASVSFTLFSVSAGAIITFLYKHMRQVAQSADRFRSPHINAHIGAMKTVTTLLILYVFYYLAKGLLFLQIFTLESKEFATCHFVTFAFPTLSSITLICGNPSMKKTLNKTFSPTKCCG